MKFKAMNIALGVDVWNEIEDELKTGLKNISVSTFVYSAKGRYVVVDIDCYEEEKIKNHCINLNQEEAESIVNRLCEKFNIESKNIARLSFRLKPGEIPIFASRFYPRVNDESTLDKTKSRMNPITID